MEETLTVNESDLGILAEKVVTIMSGKLSRGDESCARVVFLEGDLGAGKTTFTKVLAEKLGINGEDVHSPTFILKKTYDTSHPLFTKLVHVDAYRFTHPNESEALRLEEDMKDPHTLVVVEWPSKMNYMRSDLELEFKVIDEDTREVTIRHD